MDKEEYDFYAESEVLERQVATMEYVKQMEKMRRKNKVSFGVCIFFIFCTIAGVVMIYMLPQNQSTRFEGLWMIAAITLLFISIIGAIHWGQKSFFCEYRRMYKSKLVKHVLNEMFENVNYSPEDGFSYTEVSDMKVTDEGDSISSEDFIEGDYKGCHFAMSECCICADAKIDNNLNVTTFIGKIYDIDSDKNIPLDVYIYGDNFIHPNKEQTAKRKVKLESIDFGRHFQVYTTDAETAFYVLTPQLQEALLELGELFHYDFAVTMSGQRIFVAVTDYRNSLEPPNNQKIDYLTECRRIRQDMSIVIDILEALPAGNMKEKMIRHPIVEENDTVIIYEEQGFNADMKSIIELVLFWLVLVLVILCISWGK